MKRTLALVALASLAVASCSKSEYLGQNAQNQGTLSPIQIGTSVGVPTKAEGADAAALLSNKFMVWGQKTLSATNTSVFDAVPVNYANGEWSYIATNQALRYWDTNASSYDFIAISDANTITDVNHTMEKVTPKADVYADGFSIAPVTADELAKIHVTAAHNVNNTGFSSPVTFDFSNAAAKVRVAFYNAIPGYEVNVDDFYLFDNTATANTVLKGTFFGTAAYDVSNTGALTLSGTPTAATDIVLGNKIVQSPNANQYIGKTITSASFDNADKAYTNVLPVMDNGADINMKVTYRMISGHDVISRTCDVTIPAEYAKWQSNYAYTYAFKITDNDLHPITFSATVKDPENQETTTTIDGDNPVNITIYSEGSDIINAGGVKKGNDVYVSVKNVPGTFDVHSGFTTNSEVNGSNAESIITSWSYRDVTTNGRYQIQLQEAGYYVIRVTWVAGAVEKHAYMVFRCIE